MKQILHCARCDFAISTKVTPVFVTKDISDRLPIGLNKPLAKNGTCLKSNKSLIEVRYDFFKDKALQSDGKTIGGWMTVAKKRLASLGYSDQQVLDLNWLDTLEKALAGKGNKWAPKAYMLNFAPQDWLNLANIKDELSKFNEAFEYELEDNYCCGPTGFYGPNFKCKCGNYIGTVCDECNAPEVFVPDPKETKWQNVKS